MLVLSFAVSIPRLMIQQPLSSTFYIGSLPALIASCEQQDDRLSKLSEIHPISRTAINSELV
jgi:hypothetical protein